MKRPLAVVTALVVVLMSFARPGPVEARPTSRSSYKDQTVEATFSIIDSSGCIVTQVWVFATKNRTYSSPGPKVVQSDASLSIFQFDQCVEPNTVLLDANGGPTVLSKKEFKVGDGLSWASLNKTISVYDFVRNGTFDVTIALYWTSIGPISVQSNRTVFKSVSCTSITNDRSAERPSTAWGSVSDGITNYTPEPAVSTELALVKNGELVRGCAP